MDTLITEPLFEITATLNPPAMMGQRIIATISGGTVQGKINGKVLAVGGEFGTFISPETYRVDVRAAIESDDNAVIYITYNGYMHAEADVLKKLFSPAGKDIDPDTYYWRTNPLFETSDARYSWLNHTVAVGIGSYTPAGEVLYKIFAVK